jgi:hypothetical protein
MNRHFAQLDNQGIVQRVIVADSLDWCVQNLGGQWVETFADTPGKNYAGRNHKYHSDKDNFSSPQPYESWTLDKNLKWQPPVTVPLGISAVWDESERVWVDRAELAVMEDSVEEITK